MSQDLYSYSYSGQMNLYSVFLSVTSKPLEGLWEFSTRCRSRNKYHILSRTRVSIIPVLDYPHFRETLQSYNKPLSCISITKRHRQMTDYLISVNLHHSKSYQEGRTWGWPCHLIYLFSEMLLSIRWKWEPKPITIKTYLLSLTPAEVGIHLWSKCFWHNGSFPFPD